MPISGADWCVRSDAILDVPIFRLRRARRPKVCRWPWSERVAAANRKVTRRWTEAAVAILERADGLSPQNLAKAEAILRRAAHHADPLALYYLATLKAANGTDGTAGTGKDSSGLPYLQMAASGGLPLAQLALAYRFRHGIEVPKDEEIAFGMYQCHAGKALGEMNTGGAHHQTDLIRIDDLHALDSYGGESSDQFEWVNIQAQDGDDHAMVEMGTIYYWGLRGVARDFAAAFRWFRRAAHAGNPDALYTLGVMHRHGQGVAENTTKMLELFTRAADLNNSAALNGLGVYWLTVGKDVVKAKAYLQQAQDRGSGDGAFNLGALHAHMHSDVSQLGPLNMTAAIESWEVAAANGHHHARQLLAKHLASGKWVPRNLSLALTHVAETAQMSWAVGDLLHDAVTAHMDPDDDRAAASEIRYMLAGEAGIEVAQINAAQQQNDYVQPFEASTVPRIGAPDAKPADPNRAAAAAGSLAAEGTNGEGAGADAGATGGDAGDAGDAAAAAAADGAWASVEDEHNREEQPEQWRDGIRGNIYLRQLKLASYTSPEGMTQLGNAFWYGIKDTINPNRTAAEQCWLNAVADHDFAEAHFNLGYLWVTSQAADAKNFTLSERLETGRTHWQNCEPAVPCVLIGAVFSAVELGVRAADAIPASLSRRAGQAATVVGDAACSLFAELAASLGASLDGILRVIGAAKLF